MPANDVPAAPNRARPLQGLQRAAGLGPWLQEGAARGSGGAGLGPAERRPDQPETAFLVEGARSGGRAWSREQRDQAEHRERGATDEEPDRAVARIPGERLVHFRGERVAGVESED